MRDRLTGDLHPPRFIEVALHGRPPVGTHPQLPERPLYADWTTRQVDPPDVGGDAAGQWFPAYSGTAQQMHPRKRVDDVLGWRFQHRGQATALVAAAKPAWIGYQRRDGKATWSRTARSHDETTDDFSAWI